MTSNNKTPAIGEFNELIDCNIFIQTISGRRYTGKLTVSSNFLIVTHENGSKAYVSPDNIEFLEVQA